MCLSVFHDCNLEKENNNNRKTVIYCDMTFMAKGSS